MTQPLASADYRHLYSRAEDWPEPSSPLCETYLTQPRYPNDLIAHWEYFLWTEYRKFWFLWIEYHSEFRKGVGIQEPRRLQEPRECWRQLSTYEPLLALCRERPSLRLHYLLAHLCLNSHIFETPKPERVHVFGIKGTPAPLPDHTEERQFLQHDYKRLTQIRKLMDELQLSKLLFKPSRPRKLPGLVPSPEAQEKAPEDILVTFNKLLDDAIKRAERMKKNLGKDEAPIETLLAGLYGEARAAEIRAEKEARLAELRAKEKARLAELPASEQENPKPVPTPPQHGNRRLSGADVNMYLTLVVEFLRKDDKSAFPWADAFRILEHFNPTLLKDIFKPRSTDAVPRAVSSLALAERVKDFRSPKDDEQRAHVEERIQAAKDWHREPGTLRLFPDPDFLTTSPR